MLNPDLVQLSKILSRILRHTPDEIGVSLDREGWTSIDLLLKACRQHGIPLTKGLIDQIAAGTDKLRYQVKNGKIRATHGHSVEIEPREPAEPPAVLYHGTVATNLYSIFRGGINAGKRQFVHMSSSSHAALKVAGRHGEKIALLVIDAERMRQAGYLFYCQNGVWFTRVVPVGFFSCKYFGREEMNETYR